MNENQILEVVENLTSLADEIKSKGKVSDLEYGQLLAYAEALTIIRDLYEGDLSNIGLDYDIDKKYL
ncbi:MAG: hypothetical protein IJM21_12025 [Clostridia bacterium]|nr:hypothetical protein [Clostridia bacterium]